MSGGSGTGHGDVEKTQILKLLKRGQFPDDLVKKEGSQIHYVTSHTY